MSGLTQQDVDRAYLAELVTLARDLGAEHAEALPTETMWTGVSVRALADGQEVWLVRMAFNWRILETHPGACGYGRFWCYPGRGADTFVVALRHALSYGDGEPDGWIKAWDGRSGELLAGSR